MAKRIDPQLVPNDSYLFLALAWSGGSAQSLEDLIARYDWVQHAIPTTEELDGGLNRLIAIGLVSERDGRFAIPAKVLRAFDVFRQRRRRDRFTTAEAFVQQYGPLPSVPRQVPIRRADHQRACRAYLRRFQLLQKDK